MSKLVFPSSKVDFVRKGDNENDGQPREVVMSYQPDGPGSEPYQLLVQVPADGSLDGRVLARKLWEQMVTRRRTKLAEITADISSLEADIARIDAELASDESASSQAAIEAAGLD